METQENTNVEESLKSILFSDNTEANDVNNDAKPIEEVETKEEPLVENEKDEENPTDPTDTKEVDDSMFLGLSEDQWQTNDDGQVLIKVEVDKEVKHVPLKDIQASYQMTEAAEKRLKDLNATKAEFKEYATKAAEQMTKDIEQSAQFVTLLEEQLTNAKSSDELKKIKEQDFTKYSRIKDEIGERQQQLDSWKSTIAQRQEQLKQYQVQEYNQVVQQEFQKILENNPTWKEEAVAKEQFGKIQTYMQSKGFTQEEINELYDSRVVEILKDAISAIDAQKVKEGVAKKQVPRSKTVRSRPVKGQNTKKAQQNKLLKQLQSNPSNVNLQDQVIENILFNS